MTGQHAAFQEESTSALAATGTGVTGEGRQQPLGEMKRKLEMGEKGWPREQKLPRLEDQESKSWDHVNFCQSVILCACPLGQAERLLKSLQPFLISQSPGETEVLASNYQPRQDAHNDVNNSCF